jgi:small subunit ribosomal protein S21
VAEVRVQEGESLENALRRFKRKVQTEDIIKEVKRHSFYLKPGEKKTGQTSLGSKAESEKAPTGFCSTLTGKVNSPEDLLAVIFCPNNPERIKPQSPEIFQWPATTRDP